MKSSAHSKSSLVFHLVFIPKYRKPVLVDRLYDYLVSEIPFFFSNNNADCVELSVQPDHVHIMFSCQANLHLSVFIGKLKSHLTKHYFDQFAIDGPRQIWARGFYISSVGLDSSDIAAYIQNQ